MVLIDLDLTTLCGGAGYPGTSAFLTLFQGLRPLGSCKGNGVFSRGADLSTVPRRHLNEAFLADGILEATVTESAFNVLCFSDPVFLWLWQIWVRSRALPRS